MPLHRLTDVPYNGGSLPVTHDKINTPADNGDPGLPALVDSGKLTVAGHPNEGTYYIGFGEDGTSTNGNRAHDALAENTDFLDDICSGDVPVPAELEATAGAPISTLVITGDVFMGMSGVYTDTQPFRDRLIKVLDSSTGNDLVDASGVKVEVTLIRDNLNLANRVGVPVSGFEPNPTITFSPPIPNGATYRIVYGKRSTLEAGIRSKTDLDLLVRLAIRAAQQASAETIRFITQAARRTGGNITALSGTIIETPLNAVAPGGSILPKSSLMTFDLDPSDDADANPRGIVMQAARDAAPVTIFQMHERTRGGTDSVINSDLVMTFRDANTAGGGGFIPLSGATTDNEDRVLTMENDELPSPPILDVLNRRWTVTCGDGVSSFGDFNGATAISDAMTFAVGNGVTSVHILLKKGTYDCNNVDLAPAAGNVVIEGVDHGHFSGNGANINNTAALGAKSAALVAGTKLSRIEFINVNFIQGSTSELAWYSPSCYVRFKDCYLNNQSIRLNIEDQMPLLSAQPNLGGNTFEMINCVLSLGIGAVTPPLHIAVDDVFASPGARGFLVQDCEITSVDNVPALRIENVNIASGGALGGILFNRCNITLGGTTDDGGGNLTGNSGALEFVAGTTTNLTVEDIEWRDCHVEANPVGAAATILLYLRPNNGTGWIKLFDDRSEIKISGGTWKAMGDTSAFAPFVLLQEEITTLPASPVARRVIIENVRWGFENGGGTYGAATTEILGPAVAGFAAFYINASYLRMSNVQWLNATSLSDSGDLYVHATTMNIDGLYLGYPETWTAAGAGSAPEFRMKFEGSLLTQGAQKVISDVVISGAAVAATVATRGIVELVPNTNSISGPTTPVVPMVLRAFSINGFDAGVNYGFFVEGHDDGFHNGLHLENCHVTGVSADGFFFDNSAGTNSRIKDHKHTNCVYDDCGGRGIYYRDTTTVGFGEVVIQGCTLKSNGVQGIYIQPTLWTSGGGGGNIGVNIIGCHFESNNGGNLNTQLALANGATARGCAYGNSSGGGSGGGLFSQIGGPSPEFHGTETGFTYDPTLGGVQSITNAVTTNPLSANARLHTTALQMMHNRMRWSSV
jgi:hypothetical protein